MSVVSSLVDSILNLHGAAAYALVGGSAARHPHLRAAGFTLLGYLAGASYQKVEKIAGRASAVLLAIIVLAILVLLVRRRRREQADTQPDDAQSNGPTPPS